MSGGRGGRVREKGRSLAEELKKGEMMGRGTYLRMKKLFWHYAREEEGGGERARGYRGKKV